MPYKINSYFKISFILILISFFIFGCKPTSKNNNNKKTSKVSSSNSSISDSSISNSNSFYTNTPSTNPDRFNRPVILPGGSNSQVCSILNGSGTQRRSGSNWGLCNLESCNASFHISGNTCVYNMQGCVLSNAASALQSWTGTTWGTCIVSSCNENFVNTNNTCVAQKVTSQTVDPIATAAFGVCNVVDLASLDDCVAKLSTVDSINFMADVTCSGVSCCGPSGGALIALNGFSNKTIQGNSHHLNRHGSQKLCSAIQIVNSSKVSVVGLVVDEDSSVSGCAPTDNCADSIDINGSKKINFESFELYNAKSFGVGVNNVSGMVFNNSTVSNTGIIGFYAGDNSSKIAITNSTFSRTRTNAIAFQGVFGTAAGDNLIQNNQIIDNHYQGQWLSPDGGRINGGQIYIPNASYVTVSGNTISGGNCAECYDTRVWGIELGKESTSGSAGDVSHLTITQNNFSIQNGCAVFLNQGGSIDAFTLVSANMVYGSQSFTCAQANGVISNNAFPTSNLGQNTISLSTIPSSIVIGNIDSSVTDSSGQANITGWACYQKSTQPISVDLYVGAPYGSTGSIIIGRYLANMKSEGAVATSCGASGTTYRFSILLTAAQTSSYANKLIYAYGIAPAGGNNNLISNSGVLKVSSAAVTTTSPTPTPSQTPIIVPVSVAGPVMGYIDGVFLDSFGRSVISGWACAQNSAAPITIHLYANGSYPVGEIINAYTANMGSESAIAEVCHSTGTSYRFQIPITAEMSNMHRGQVIYIHAISPNGGDNSVIPGSGIFKIP
ncbi:MAG: right-handed parallel beta-helix repeat-containing protein [Bacteriovorax sp.]|nr:right-handed parallel beta-helix repeat-containing protein [Bacteriovorax sp.]